MTDPQGRLFSVVMLISRQSPHLGGAMRSALGQRVEDLEMIVIDDAASASDHDAVEQLARQSNIPTHIVHTGGKGRHRAWNAGAQVASGRYLAFLEADDEYHPDRLDAFRRAHSICGGFVWGFSGVEAIDAQDRPVAVETIRDRTLRSTMYSSTRPVEAIRNLPQMFTPVSCGNLVVDARVFRELGGFREYPHLSAWDLTLRLLRTGDPVTIERPLYRHRVRHDGAPAGESPASQPRLVDQEQTAIVEEYWRGLAQDGLADGPLAPSRGVGPTSPLDSDAQAAFAAALWGLDQLRRVPLLYKTARRMARLTRRVRGRFR